MNRLRCILITGLVLAALPSTASAARPVLTQHEADREAQSYIDTMLSGIATDDDSVDPVSADLDSCELLIRSKAECDFTAVFEDGDSCDGLITVQKTRRGRIVSDIELVECDSEFEDA